MPLRGTEIPTGPSTGTVWSSFPAGTERLPGKSPRICKLESRNAGTRRNGKGLCSESNTTDFIEGDLEKIFVTFRKKFPVYYATRLLSMTTGSGH
jgi:hypothetical protein